MRNGIRLLPANALKAFLLLVVVGISVVVAIYGGIYAVTHRSPADGFPKTLTYLDRHYDRNGEPVAEMPRSLTEFDYSKVDHIDDPAVDLYAAVQPRQAVGTGQLTTIVARGENGLFVAYTLQGGP
ncbi:hypothetical protein ACFWNH_08355 [Rhodococcus qingshengii]|uniref:Uncharacterized protein n=1 Tax=Rhodococcus erythropolis TaxID=1833 RepID=A0AAX3ZZJ9_RHOER|nr:MULTISPECIES: hypothetical protein [Rhodococcus erythropolis group]WMN02084.1 hypothetical protein QIE55_30480 [Rhodococcus erythropolis]